MPCFAFLVAVLLHVSHVPYGSHVLAQSFHVFAGQQGKESSAGPRRMPAGSGLAVMASIMWRLDVHFAVCVCVTAGCCCCILQL